MASFDCSKDYYSLLGVPRDAREEDIRRAYHTKAREDHPDVGGSPDRMKSLNEAYRVLKDREMRKAYDLALNPAAPSPQWSPPPSSYRPPYEIPGRAMFLKDVRWLLTRAGACFLFGVIYFVGAEDPVFMRKTIYSWLMRFMGFATFGLGVLLAYTAHKINDFYVRKKSVAYDRARFKTFRLAFISVALAWIILLIIG
ncbi:MAG: DnaJ domain-containing protein [Blastocatellia bacterium]|nr:DnaJ domain-containing protein [Blastocatellia bacterium]